MDAGALAPSVEPAAVGAHRISARKSDGDPGARLHIVDEKATRALEYIKKQQEIEASKQIVITGWPEDATRAQRHEVVQDWAEFFNMGDEVQSIQTIMVNKKCAHFTIAEFYDRHARDHFKLQAKSGGDNFNMEWGGSKVVLKVRSQIPKYQREADQPLKCAMKSAGEAFNIKQRMQPIWDMKSVWFSDSWLLHVKNPGEELTEVELYVKGDLNAFMTDFSKRWETWGAPERTKGKGKGKGKDKERYRVQDFTNIQVFPLSQALQDELNGAYDEHVKYQHASGQDAAGTGKAEGKGDHGDGEIVMGGTDAEANAVAPKGGQVQSQGDGLNDSWADALKRGPAQSQPKGAATAGYNKKGGPSQNQSQGRGKGSSGSGSGAWGPWGGKNR